MTIAKCTILAFLALISLQLPAQDMSTPMRMHIEGIAGLLTRSEKSIQGDEWTEPTRTVTEVYQRFAPDRKILRVAIHSDFDTRTEARWVSDHWDVGTFRYLGGTICSKLADGTCRVYRISFRQRLGDAGFSPLEIFGIGSSYEILEENVSG